MRIETINIDSFGSLSGVTLAFNDGINIIEGPNESGKSTISAFIKFMLYGVSGRAVEGAISERKRVINWSGNVAKGSMIINHDFNRYRIERTLSVYTEGPRESVRESVEIIDLATNSSCFKGQIPGEVFLGVSEKVFVSTAYFRQLSDTGIDAAEMNNAIENMLFSADETVNTKKALDKLDAARRMLFYKNGTGGAIYENKLELEQKKKQHDEAKRTNEDIFATEGILAEKTNQYNERKTYIDELRRKKTAVELYNALKQFDRLHRQEESVSVLDAEYDRLREERGHNGFLPDSAYVDDLRQLEHRIASTSLEVSKKETELSRLKYESGELSKQLEILAEIEERGGADAVLKEYDGALLSARSYKVFGFVMLLLSALIGAGGYILSLLVRAPWARLLPVGLVVLLLSGMITFFFVSHKNKRLAKEISEKFGATGGQELRAIFNKCFEDKQRLSDHQKELSLVREQLDELESQQTQYKEQLDARLAEMGIRLENHTREVIVGAISRCEEISRAADQILRRLEAAKEAMLATAERLAHLDENKIRAEIAEFDPAELEKINISELNRDLKLNESQMESINKKIRDLSSKLAALNATADDPVRIAAQITELERKIEKDTLRHDAYVLASEAIKNSGESLRKRISPSLSDYACKMISAMTDGKYRTIGVDGQLEMTFESDGGTRSLDYLSAGTRDLAYIGLRLALIDLLFREGTPPLMFDESFSHQDNDRASRLFKLLYLLSTEGQQSIIFTCHDREGKLAARMGNVKLIKLG